MAQVLYKLYFLAYNNYYERISKKEDSLSEYLDYLVYTTNELNFNSNDGVDTYIDINYSLPQSDYVLVADPATNKIISRWFVIEFSRNLQGSSKGQYRCKLHRDLLADYRDSVMNAQAYISKGIVNESDNTIFNNEGGIYNQIKTQETLLKDKSECQWIVGYYARKTGKEGSEAYTNLTGSGEAYTFSGDYDEYPTVEDYPYYSYSTSATPFIGFPDITLRNVVIENIFKPKKITTLIYQNGWSVVSKIGGGGEIAAFGNATDLNISKLPNTAKQRQAALFVQIKNSYNFHTVADEQAFVSQNGYIFKAKNTGKYYKVTINNYGAHKRTFNTGATGTLHDQYAGIYTDAGMTVENIRDYEYSCEAQEYGLSISLLDTTAVSYNYNIPTTRNYTYDAPYDIFAIPYSDTFKFSDGTTTVTASKDISMAVATGISSKYAGSGTVYDVQLLPYCPFNITGTTYTTRDTKEFSYITQGTNKVGVIFNISSVNRPSFTIPLSIAVDDVKIDNETKFCRLVSPNYASIFEFSPAKNRGVDYIKVDITLKPFSPYIHLAPNFKGLNGGDYDDARGLICSGDFSLPVVTDQWKTYELQNKNYEKQFDRQIQNMEVNNSYGLGADIAGAVTSAVGGGVAGAMTGLGPAGIIGGAAAGLAGGVADVAINQAMRKESINYTKDQWQMQMQNIKALPNTLTKIDSFNIQNKGWPFVEYYDCTEEEKYNLCNKILYSGMTVNRFGRLSDYKSGWSYPSQAGTNDKWVTVYFPYLEGNLIWINGNERHTDEIFEDYHLFSAINNEVRGGFYFV